MKNFLLWAGAAAASMIPWAILAAPLGVVAQGVGLAVQAVGLLCMIVFRKKIWDLS